MRYDNVTLSIDLTNPDILLDGHIVLSRDSLQRELFCGFRRRRGAGPTPYPVTRSPQAWASGALFLMIQASLGIEFDPGAKQIRFRN